MRRELIWLLLCLAIIGPAGAFLALRTADATMANTEQVAALDALEAARRAMLTKPLQAGQNATGNDLSQPARPLFPVAAPQLPAAIPEQAGVLPRKLLLRGIIVTDSVARAIFGVEDTDAPYRTVGVGDTIETYIVEEVDRNSVTLRDSMGRAEIFQLRGVGEGPSN